MRHLRHYLSRWQNWLGLLLVLLFVVMAIAAPALSPMDPKQPDIFKQVGRTRSERMNIDPQPPSDIALLGTLPYQYDVYHTLVWGSRDALKFGLGVVLIAGVFGVVYGAVAGFSGGFVNTVLMRVADAFLAFPVIAGVVFLQQLMAVAIEAAGGFYLFNTQYQQFFGKGPMVNIVGDPAPIQVLLSFVNPLMLCLILFMWMPYARLINTMVLSLKNTEFVHASRALGSSSTRTVFRHVIPNSISPAMVLMARDVGGVVILQATLTFIGLGGNSPWGDMLSQGRNWIISAGGLLSYWWVYIPATAAVMLFAIAWNLLGDGLNDALDPAAHYDFHRPPFWMRVFRRKAKPLPEPAQPVLAVEPLLQTASVPGIQEQGYTPGQKFRYSDGTDPILLAAREDIVSGNLQGGLHAYRHLIQRGRLIPDILPDLARLVQSHPRDPDVWQAMGDALNRAGDRAHATQSYEKARKSRQ
jgi:peptide/nickel transport system permease protein